MHPTVAANPVRYRGYDLDDWRAARSKKGACGPDGKLFEIDPKWAAYRSKLEAEINGGTL